MVTHTEVIVIGGGLIGACCAEALTRRDLEVVLLERRFPASGSSRACDGLILLWDKSPGAELELGKASVALWEVLAPQLETDIEFRKTGTLLINDDISGIERSRKMAERLVDHDIRAIILDPDELGELEPSLAGDLAGGVYYPDDYQLDPRRATLAILRKAQRQGLHLAQGEEVLGLERRAGTSTGWRISTREHIFTADHVVCAAGVWSRELLDAIGAQIPVRPRQGHILVLKPAPDTLRHPVLEGSYEATVHAGGGDLQVALVAEQTASGTLLIGSSRQFTGFDTGVSWEVMQTLARRAIRFIPGLQNAALIRSYAGLRPWSPDNLPLIGAVPGYDDLHIASGHEGAGICLAPVTGQLIADWVSGDELPEFARDVDPARFSAETAT